MDEEHTSPGRRTQGRTTEDRTTKDLAAEDLITAEGPAAPAVHGGAAEAVRALGARAGAAAIREALAHPQQRAGDLAAIFRDPGTRDAAIRLSMAAPEGWPQLAAAARAAGRHALAAGTPGANGALAVLAHARWHQGDDAEALRMCAAVPAGDDARRFADLTARAVVQGIAPAEYDRSLGRVTVKECLAFARPPADAPPAAGAGAWFAETADPAADSGSAWQIDPEDVRRAGQTALAVLQRDGVPAALVTTMPGRSPLLLFEDPADAAAWRGHAAATAGGDDDAAIRALLQPGGARIDLREPAPGPTAAAPAARHGHTGRRRAR